MSQLTFLDALRKGPLLFDGAMGTMLYERGILYTQSFDAVSLTRPELVRSIHQEYLRAGAQALLTNTFGANRFRLASHQLEGEVRAINQAGLRIAREVAAPHKAWVGASIGPSGVLLRSLGASELNRIGDAFTEQIEALLWPEPPLAPPDFFMLETFRQMGELRIALERARKLIEGLGSEKRPAVVASLSFDGFGTTADGLEPEEVARRLLDWGADAIGVNCADGPAGVYESACRMLEVGLPIVARPNAGLPRRVEGRLAYMATPEYFQLYARRLLKAGILGVGGCCGTTPDHIRQMAASVRMRAASVEEGEGESMAHEKRSFFMAKVEEEKEKVIPLSEKGELGAKLARGDFIVSVEVNPPPGLFLEKAIQAARMLRDGGVDAINVADGARASARMGNFVLCLRIQEQVGLPTLMHVTTRDRNLLGLVAHLLACHELGLHNLVIITGDPPKMGDFPDATPVYDLDSIGLLRLVSHLNRGFDPGGKPLGGATRFLCATGAEPAAQDFEREIRRLRLKVEAGAEVVMTQPVYDPAVLDRFLREISDLPVKVLVGILPLASYKNAEFLHNEVPGMSVPFEIRERMRKAGSGEAARKEGVRIAREMLDAVKSRVHGVYIMPPLGRYELALQVIDGIVR